jgi:hypothetical protein
VFIPYFTCDVILEPFNKLAVDYEFYSTDMHYPHVFDFDGITCMLYNSNEFGKFGLAVLEK